MKETVLNDLNNGLAKTVDQYKNAEVPEVMDKTSCIQMLSREIKLISDEEKRAFDSKMQEERMQLDKDHKYWSEKFEETKFKEEVSNNKVNNEIKKEELELSKKKFDSECEQRKVDNKLREREFELSKDKLATEKVKQDFMIELEKTKLKLEETRIEMEKSNMAYTERAREFDQKYKLISLAISVVVPAVTSLITLAVYKKLAYENLKLIYVDEGRPTKDFGDACQSIKKLIK